MSDTVYYAIGDVHGEDEKLERLHDFIRDDARRLGVAPFFVHLGDLIDRGPESRGVIARVMSLHEREGDRAVTLKGNHEELLLHAYANRDSIGIYHWAENGGDETIASYMLANGAEDDWRDAIDREHLAWLRALPAIWRDEGRRLAFVHGGIDPQTFPDCSDEVRMWTRSNKFFDPRKWPNRPELEGLTVIHGHTPTEDFAPHVGPRRINVDTGVCLGGPLTCVVLAPDEGPRFLHAR
jgi:serine/threonine protein phosphatase 1